MPGEEDGGAADNDRGSRERVAQHVNEGAADVDVTRGGPKQGGDYAVHQDAGRGDDHHQPGLHLHRLTQPMDGRNGDPDGDQNQRQRVEKGCQDAGSLVAEGLLVGRRPSLKVDGDERQQQGQKVGYVMAGLRDQSERMGMHSGYEGKDHIAQRGQQRYAQNSLRLLRRPAMNVHTYLVYREAAHRDREAYRMERAAALGRP